MAAPTARTVCPSAPARSPPPLTEIGTSPGAEGVEHRELAGAESADAVTAGGLQLERPGVRQVLALVGDDVGDGQHRVGGHSARSDVSVDVEQPHPGRLQALHDHRDEPPHQLVAERGVLVGTCRAGRPRRRRPRAPCRAHGRRGARGTAAPATTSRAGHRRRSSRSSRRRAAERRSPSPPGRAG